MTKTPQAQPGPGVPFELDGKVTYLSPDSAEGKALQRVRNPVPESELITEVDETTEIDLKELDEWLRQQGNSPTSGAEQI